MKKTILTNLKYLAFALVLAFATAALAQWSTPGAAAPSANIAAPVHVGPYQTKDSGLSVNGFAAWQNSAFNQHLTLEGIVRGGVPSDTTSTVVFGAASTPTNILVSGNVATNSYMQSQSVANTSSKTLCADAMGIIFTCGNSDQCLNFAGEQTSVPAGHTQNSQGNCIPNSGRQYITSGFNKFTAVTIYQTTNMSSISDEQRRRQLGEDPQRIIGLDTFTVIKNELSGFIPSSLSLYAHDAPPQRIWNVQEGGNYKIVFTAKGYFQTYALRRGNTAVWVDFFLKINDLKVPLAPVNSANNCGATGGTGQVGITNTTTQFFMMSDCQWNDSTGRKHTETMYYNLNFDRTYALQPGDVVEFYGTVRGMSKESSFINSSDYRDYDFRLGSTSSYFEVTKLP